MVAHWRRVGGPGARGRLIINDNDAHPRGHRRVPVPLRSRYRRLFRPLVRFVTAVARAHPGRPVAVVIPQLVERRWYHYLLHDQTASILKALLLLRGPRGIIIINTPWYVGEPAGEATA